MGDETREFDGPGGTFRLRPARPEDESFQFDLFCANHIAVLQLGGLPAPMIESLLTMQYRSRGQSYRQTYPQARWSILEAAGEPIGALIESDEADAVYIVDISLRPERQRRGIGSALIRAIAIDGTSRGGVRALAAVGNAPSRKMFARLGFVETDCGDGANVELRWRPPFPAVPPPANPSP